MVPSSQPLVCDVIYIYCKVALPAIENTEEVERFKSVISGARTYLTLGLYRKLPTPG